MARRSAGGRLQELAELFRRLNLEQRVAAVAALLLVVSTFGPFSFVEAAEILTGLGVLALLRARAQGREFHLPLGDGTAIAAAGVWAALLIIARLFDRPLGQNLLALACAAILVAAGVRERAKRPADDLPAEPVDDRARDHRPAREPQTRRLARTAPAIKRGPGRGATARRRGSDRDAPRAGVHPAGPRAGRRGGGLATRARRDPDRGRGRGAADARRRGGRGRGRPPRRALNPRALGELCGL